MRKMMAVLPFVFVLVLMVGCAKPPQDSITAATTAMDAAKPMASEYAPSSLQAAEDAKAALDAEIKAQQDKFALFRSYKKTDELVADLKAKSDKAAADAAAGKAQAKNDATTAINDATTALTDAQAMLDKAPKGKGTAADLEAMKADLTAAESTINDANTAMAAEKFKDAKAKADAAKSSAANVVSQIQAAMEAKKTAGAKPAHKK
jgi:small-conductance mechanosensitive channel